MFSCIINSFHDLQLVHAFDLDLDNIYDLVNSFDLEYNFDLVNNVDLVNKFEPFEHTNEWCLECCLLDRGGFRNLYIKNKCFNNSISTSKPKNIYFSCQIKWLNIFLVRLFSFRQINLTWKVNLFKPFTRKILFNSLRNCK